ncbi:hypothetical protein PMIN04_005841 [Paraphaeosphaeria minitans]
MSKNTPSCAPPGTASSTTSPRQIISSTPRCCLAHAKISEEKTAVILPMHQDTLTMLEASTSRLAINVSRAGRLGFIAGGTDPATLNHRLEESKQLSYKTFNCRYADPLQQ